MGRMLIDDRELEKVFLTRENKPQGNGSFSKD